MDFLQSLTSLDVYEYCHRQHTYAYTFDLDTLLLYLGLQGQVQHVKLDTPQPYCTYLVQSF